MAGRRQSFTRMLGRASLLKCPWCGSRRSFVRGWFTRYDRCRTCGIAWHREEGFELGAVTVNMIVTFGALAIAMTVGFVVTAPDIPVVPLVLSLIGSRWWRRCSSTRSPTRCGWPSTSRSTRRSRSSSTTRWRRSPPVMPVLVRPSLAPVSGANAPRRPAPTPDPRHPGDRRTGRRHRPSCGRCRPSTR